MVYNFLLQFAGSLHAGGIIRKAVLYQNRTDTYGFLVASRYEVSQAGSF